MNNMAKLGQEFGQYVIQLTSELLVRTSQPKSLTSLQQRFGRGRWRKLKGVATVRLSDGTIRLAEIHWYEAHGIGKKRMKIKRYLD